MTSPGRSSILQEGNIHRKSRKWFREKSVFENGLGEVLFYFVFSIAIARHIYTFLKTCTVSSALIFSSYQQMSV
jgi:hypothetical protein